MWYLRGTYGVLHGTHGVFRGTARVPRDYLRGTPMVLPGDCTHARGRSSRGALAHSRGYCTLRGTLWYTGVLHGTLGLFLLVLEGDFPGSQCDARVLRG
jgi:hypothetical protein